MRRGTAGTLRELRSVRPREFDHDEQFEAWTMRRVCHIYSGIHALLTTNALLFETFDMMTRVRPAPDEIR